MPVSRSRVLLFGAALLAAATIAAGEDTTPRVVELPSSWTVGTRFDLTIEKGRRDTEGDAVLLDQQTSSKVVLEVVRASEDGYLFRWTLTDVTFPESAVGSELAAKLAEIGKGMALDLRTDAYGTVAGLENAEEVRRSLEAAFAAVRASTIASGMDEKTLAAVLDPLIQSMLGEAMESFVLKEPILLTFPAGGSFTLGEKRTYEDSLPLPLTGEAIPTRAAFLLESVDVEDRTAVLSWYQELDSERTALAVERFLKDTVARLGEEAPDFPEGFTIDVRDEARFVYDLTTGFPRTVDWSRTTNLGTRRRVDWLRFATAR